MTKQDWSEGDLLTPAEVAAIFKVDPKTVAGWAKSGKLRAIKTLGGHRRYLESQVLDMLHEETPERGDHL